MNELLRIQREAKGKEYEKWAFLYSSSKWGWTGPLIRTVWTAAWQQSFRANHWEEKGGVGRRGGGGGTKHFSECERNLWLSGWDSHYEEEHQQRGNMEEKDVTSVKIKPIWSIFSLSPWSFSMLNWEREFSLPKGIAVLSVTCAVRAIMTKPSWLKSHFLKSASRMKFRSIQCVRSNIFGCEEIIWKNAYWSIYKH